MGYTTDLTSWPSPPLSQGTKHLLESLFISLDDPSDYGSNRLADEVFAPDGEMVSNHPARGSAGTVVSNPRMASLGIY